MLVTSAPHLLVALCALAVAWGVVTAVLSWLHIQPVELVEVVGNVLIILSSLLLALSLFLRWSRPPPAPLTLAALLVLSWVVEATQWAINCACVFGRFLSLFGPLFREVETLDQDPADSPAELKDEAWKHCLLFGTPAAADTPASLAATDPKDDTREGSESFKVEATRVISLRVARKNRNPESQVFWVDMVAKARAKSQQAPNPTRVPRLRSARVVSLPQRGIIPTRSARPHVGLHGPYVLGPPLPSVFVPPPLFPRPPAAPAPLPERGPKVMPGPAQVFPVPAPAPALENTVVPDAPGMAEEGEMIPMVTGAEPVQPVDSDAMDVDMPDVDFMDVDSVDVADMMDIDGMEDAFIGSNVMANAGEDAMEVDYQPEPMDIDDEAHPEPLLSVGSQISALPVFAPIPAVSNTFDNTAMEIDDDDDIPRFPFLAGPQPTGAFQTPAFPAPTFGQAPAFATPGNVPEKVPAQPAAPVHIPSAPVTVVFPSQPPVPPAPPAPTFGSTPVFAAADNTPKKVAPEVKVPVRKKATPLNLVMTQAPAQGPNTSAPPAAQVQALTPAPFTFGLAAQASTPSTSFAPAVPVASSFDFSVPSINFSAAPSNHSNPPDRSAKRRTGNKRTQIPAAAAAPVKAPALATPAPTIPAVPVIAPVPVASSSTTSAPPPANDTNGKGKASTTAAEAKPIVGEFIAMDDDDFRRIAKDWMTSCREFMSSDPLFDSLHPDWPAKWWKTADHLLVQEIRSSLGEDYIITGEEIVDITKKVFPLSLFERGGPGRDGRIAVLRHLRELAAEDGIDLEGIEEA
ncbi:hypothetical protein VTJ04DRAFT_9824 [Mycothermus thermophilus]|uniref:uncharacterized protein n=1 Tax=Humicola insolens TaxID=85995 RepID=UPI003743808F